MRVKWVVNDGYPNTRRPQYTEVDDDELAECETEDKRKFLIKDSVEMDFNNNVKFEIIED